VVEPAHDFATTDKADELLLDTPRGLALGLVLVLVLVLVLDKQMHIANVGAALRGSDWVGVALLR
jgi:hypothetical protein